MTSTPFRQPLTSALKIDGQERFDLAFLRRLLQAIDVRLKPLQEQQASVEQTLVDLQGLTLDRINDILTPAIEQVFTLTERGFLIASSATEATLGIGDILTFIVADDAERDLFTPSPFTALTRSGSTGDWAIARTISYDKVAGEYRCEVLTFEGNAGPHSDWVIGALAGATVAQYSLLEEGEAVRDEVIAARETTKGYRDTAKTHKDAAAGSASAAAGSAGAAWGFAGAASDAADAAAQSAQDAATFDPASYYDKGEVDTALGDKADSTHSHEVGDVSGLAEALDGKLAKTFATKTEAEVGSNNTKPMSPLRTKEAIAALSPGLTTDSTSGAAQTVDFSSNKIHMSVVDAATVTYTFSSPATVAKVDLVLDAVAVSGPSMAAAAYDEISFDVSAQVTVPHALALSSDGTKMYVAGTSSGKVDQYALSTAWDLSTASYTGISLTLTTDITAHGIAFKPDGTKLYTVEATADEAHQYSLSTAWDLSTASNDGISYALGAQESQPHDIWFKPDGTKMYISGLTNDRVWQYSLSTAWNLSTASYDNKSFLVASQEGTPYALGFSADGTKMFIGGNNGKRIFQYSLSTAWDVSTASYDVINLDVVSIANSPSAMDFSADGSKMYMSSNDDNRVYQFSVGLPGTIVFPAEVQSPSITLAATKKTAITIATADGGTSYQVLSVQGGIV